MRLRSCANRTGLQRTSALTIAQLFTHSRAQEHYQQLLPLFPGVAKPLLQIVEYARARPRGNPAAALATDPASVGVIAYTGAESRSAIDHPLQYHVKGLGAVPGAAQLLASVHPLQSTQFAELHFAEKLALATYGGGGSAR